MRNSTEKPTIGVCGKCKSINYYGINAKRALDAIYKDSYYDIYLDRKYKKYLEVVDHFAKSSVSSRIDINSNKIEDLFNQVRV